MAKCGPNLKKNIKNLNHNLYPVEVKQRQNQNLAKIKQKHKSHT